MITFLPYSDFDKVGTCLDTARLGKQRLEALQILNVLTGKSFGYQHHPAVKMWKNHEYTLARYGHSICLAWRARNYKDTLLPQFEQYLGELPICSVPDFIYNKTLIRSHRSNLIRKFPEYYGPMWPKIPSTMSYMWPNRYHVKVVSNGSNTR